MLLPTEACNFRCVYCYERFAHGRMKRPVVDGVKALLARRAPRLSFLTVSWFGGEPLLARDIIREIMCHAATLAGAHGFLLVADMATNGYLLDRPTFEQALDWGVSRYQIAFDGPRAWHDRRRLRADGRGTFDRIWSNVLALREVEREFTVVMRIHVDHENRSTIPSFVDACQEALGTDRRFRLFLRPLSRLGGARDAELEVFDEEEESAALAPLVRWVEERGLTRGGSQPDGICYAARANSLVVRADGRLNKCTVALDHPGNQVGRILPDGRLELDTPRMERWIRGVWSRDPKALRCPLLDQPPAVSSP